MIFNKTVDSIVSKFNTMVTDLEDLAEAHKMEVEYHNKEIDYHKTSAEIMSREHQRALNIASKIKELING